MLKKAPDSLNELIGLYMFVLGTIQENSVGDWMDADLSSAQIKTLFLVVFKKPPTVNHISTLLRVGQPTASHLVEKLVHSGLLERIENPLDRRSVQVKPTQAGLDMVQRLMAGRDELLRKWLEQLTPQAINALWEGLSALRDVVLADSIKQINTPSLKEN